MILGISLDEACILVGHSHGTYTREIVKALGDRALDPKLQVLRSKLPPKRAVLKAVQSVKGRKSPSSHWILKWDDKVLDPSLPGAISLEGWEILMKRTIKMRITSALRIR